MAYEYQSFATLGVNLNRQNYGALDISQVFNSQGDLDYYLSKGTNKTKVSDYWKNIVPYPYEGQVVALVIEGDSNTSKKIQVGVLQLGKDNNFIFSQLAPIGTSDDTYAQMTLMGVRKKVDQLESRTDTLESIDTIVINGMGVPEELKNGSGSLAEWNGEYDGWTFESGE